VRQGATPHGLATNYRNSAVSYYEKYYDTLILVLWLIRKF